ncbi:MAG: hypothetical protein WAV18_19375 [Roseiarcus sp.]
MSKPTASADGGAMPASGQPPNIAEAFEQTRSLIIAASNLAAADETPGLHAVICAAEEQFKVAFDWFKAGHAPIASPAADPDPERELLHIVDEINVVRHLIEAAHMASGALVREECDALQNVLNIASDKLTAARDKLNIARGAPVEEFGHD